MVWGLFKPDSVSEAYKKMKAEELKGNQHKLDKNKNGKLDGDDFRKLRGEETEEELDALISEVLSKDASAGTWISDFVHSDNPKFAGKSKEKRKQMALAAYYAAQKKESTEYESFIELDEEADLVKTGSKEIKHANVKDKQDDQDDFGPTAKGERDFLDKLSVQVTDDPAANGHKTGADKLSAAAKPTGKGAGSYNGDSKLSSKDKASFKESAGEKEHKRDEDDTNEEAGCSTSKGKKTYAKFKAEKTNWKKGC
jgi:hypothetical protein